MTLAIGAGFLAGGFVLVEEADGGVERTRSPRMQTSGWITERPISTMCWVPTSWFLRATLLPVSVSM